jgi:hypothetical protein
VLFDAVDHVMFFLSLPDPGGIDLPQLVQQIMLPAVVLPAVPLALGAGIALRRNRI